MIDALTLSHEVRDYERLPIAALLRRQPRLHRGAAEVVARARAYAETHLAGRVERWDDAAGRDHARVPWPAIDAALPYGFLGMSVPALFGGRGVGPLGAGLFAEEIAAVDAGVFVIFGAHGLALATLLGALDARLLARVAREILDGERAGRPVLLALAHTEPGGGSDVEDGDELPRCSFGSRYAKVPGGYRLRARKVFISNGAIARYSIVTAVADPRRPHQRVAGFLVPHDAPGFSVGRVEHKLGQRLCSAAEVVCDDVFVPDEDVFTFGDPGRVIDTILSLSRPPVAAMAAGIIRGTLERTLAYLAQKRVRGRWLFEEQWVQLRLAELLASLQAARGLYLDAALAVEAWGLPRLAGLAPWRAPGALLRHRATTAAMRALYRSRVPQDALRRIVGHGSIAKLAATDLSVKMAMAAMEILGEDANDPRWGVEKCMRDAKLGQIFEGTNQINRLHVTRGLVTRREPRAAPAPVETRRRPPARLARGVARALWSVGKVERAEGTVLRTLRQAIARRGLAFARDWTFAELLEHAAATHGYRPFLEYGRERATFVEVNRRANRVARALRAAGVGEGVGVALCLSNHPRFLDAFFAIQKLGACAVPVNTALVGEGLAYVLDHSEVRAAICDHETAAKVAAGRPARLEHLWVNTDEAPLEYALPDGARDFAELERGTVADGENLDARPPAAAPSLLLYTSGTTGLPKAVVQRYGGQRVKAIGLLANLLYDRSDKLYTCLPLFHANALLLTMMPALWLGIPVALAKRFSASRFWQEVAASGATQLNTVGGIIPILLKSPPSPWDRAHRVRRIISAACPKDAWVPFEERFGLTIWEGYGAVDGGGVTIFNTGDGPVGSLGRPRRGTRWRLVDDAGRDVPRGQAGELWVHVGERREGRVEYWRNQQASNEKVVDGWLRTADLMIADEQGYLYFVGRNTDSMRRRGENVSAHEIERVVDAHPDVLESAAFGVPSPVGEQDIMLAVVPVDGRSVDPRALLAWLAERVPRYAVPTWIDVVAELPKTATHRVIKKELAQRGVTPTAVRA